MGLSAPVWALVEPRLFAGVLLLARLVGLTQLLPALGGATGAVPSRTLLLTMLTVFCWTAVGGPSVPVPAQPLVAIPMLARELLIGAALGLVVQVLLAAADAAGSIAAMAMSLSMGGLVDPTSGEQSPAIANLLSVASGLLFVALGGHREVISGLVANLQHWPLGGHTPLGLDAEALSALGEGLFAAALKLAAPVLIVTTLVNVGLGLLARAAPQINLFAVGFALLVVAGLVVLEASVLSLDGRMQDAVPDLAAEMNASLREVCP